VSDMGNKVSLKTANAVSTAGVSLLSDEPLRTTHAPHLRLVSYVTIYMEQAS